MPRPRPRTRALAFAAASTTLPSRARRPPCRAAQRACAVACSWRVAHAPDGCLRLALALRCGQAFRWRDHGSRVHAAAHGGRAREFAGVVGARLLVLRQADVEPPPGARDPVWFRVAAGERAGADAALRDYLRLGHDLSPLVARFCHADARFNHAFPVFRGARVVRQDPAECLFAFICSSNNNIKRIAGMVHCLAARYGQPLGEHDGMPHYVFPTVRALARHATEADLRAAGFGYRAKYVVATARELQRQADDAGTSAEELLRSWRQLDRHQVTERLVALQGVGKKVAGCVALFSLDKFGEIPVDTHIWQIAIRYLPDLKHKSLTNRVYEEVGDYFRAKFGDDYAGLAHSIMFAGELPDFKPLMPGNEVVAAPPRRKRKTVEKEEEDANKKVDVVVKVEKSEQVIFYHDLPSNVETTTAVVKEEHQLLQEEKPVKRRRKSVAPKT